MFLSLLDLLRQSGSLMNWPDAAMPEVTITDQGDHLLVRAALHGIDPQSVQLQVSETSLAIGGRSTMEERTEGADFYRMQYMRQDFFRVLPLPVPVQPNGITGGWQSDGVLLVKLPKRPHTAGSENRFPQGVKPCVDPFRLLS